MGKGAGPSYAIRLEEMGSEHPVGTTPANKSFFRTVRLRCNPNLYLDAAAPSMQGSFFEEDSSRQREMYGWMDATYGSEAPCSEIYVSCKVARSVCTERTNLIVPVRNSFPLVPAAWIRSYRR